MEIFHEYGFEFLLRYAHVISGVVWIGLLYYFNFVQTPAFAGFEAPARNEAFAKLVPRALWWFRWGAMSTLGFGLLLFVSQEQYKGDFMKTPPGMAIATGILFALIMFSNVWFVIWPAQKIVIANAEGVLAGREADPAAAGAARRGACASRTNTLLSIPMLFFMVATSHLAPLYQPVVKGRDRGIWWLMVILVAVVAEGIALRVPAVGKPEAWHIDQHKNTLIAGFGLLVVMYVVWQALLG
jgi:uncharacterized membrane protein